MDAETAKRLNADYWCNRDSRCTCTWKRDPALEVECPDCRAPVGSPCKRPSGHRVWGGEPHPERDKLADRMGFYGTCPLGLCGLENVARRKSGEDSLSNQQELDL